MTMFTRGWRALIFLAPLSLALGGCPAPSPDVFIFNNFGSDAVIESRYGTVAWPTGALIELENYHLINEPSDTGGSTYIGVVLEGRLVRYNVDIAVRYGSMWVDGDALTLQLEKDGKIYLAGTEKNGIAYGLPEQPVGLPLAPQPSSETMTPYPDRQSGKRS